MAGLMAGGRSAGERQAGKADDPDADREGWSYHHACSQFIAARMPISAAAVLPKVTVGQPDELVEAILELGRTVEVQMGLAQVESDGTLGRSDRP